MKKTMIYRRPMCESLFEEELTIAALSAMGNPLELLAALVDFEMFRPILEDILVKKDRKSTAGRPQFDVVLMFKVIFLQRYYGLGDKQIQYQIIDHTSFRQFLGIHTVDEIPDEKTVWNVRNILSKAGTFDVLFDRFRSYLDSKGLSFNEGKIIDASFVEAPRQRNTREENAAIKDGRGGELWNPEPGESERERKRKLNKKRHKDIDARWAKKRDKIHYGYNGHVKADKRTKLIEKYVTTYAGVHERLVCSQHRNHPCQGSNCPHLSGIQHIQVCANQQIPAAAYLLHGITVSERQQIKSNEWIKEQHSEPGMLF